MKVNFNHLRKRALWAYDDLAKLLNKNIYKWEEVELLANNKLTYQEKHIVISIDQLQEKMDELRELLMAIGFIYQSENADFREVSGECLPIAKFNDEEANNEQKNKK